MRRETVGLKKVISIVSLSIIGAVLVSYIIFTYPRTFNRSYEGVEFRVGESNKELLEKVTISFEGKFSSNPLFGHKFKGQVKIGETIIPEQVEEIELKFEKQGTHLFATIGYFYYDNESNRTEFSLYGWMLIDDAMDNIMIQVAEPDSDGGKSWDSEDGLTIVVPATTREKAVGICNKFYEGIGVIPFE